MASISLTFWARSSTTRTVASSAIAAPAVEVPAHLGREVAHADRLLEVPVEALLECAGPVRRHGEGGEGHHRYAGGARIRAQHRQGGVTVDPGELQVHEDDVRAGPLRLRDGVLARGQHPDGEPVELQDVPGELEVALVVLDQ